VPICKFCESSFKSGRGIYCSNCSDERKKIASKYFNSLGKISVVRGKHTINVLPSQVREDDITLEEFLEKGQ